MNRKVTLFAMPKGFQGHIGVIQRNAICSWVRLVPRPQIILFGDDPGTADAAAEFGVTHVGDVARNEHGTPLVGHLFARAQDLAAGGTVCYVNADIILLDDLLASIAKISAAHYLMVGHRWDIDIREPLGFEDGWQERLRLRIRTEGKLHSHTGIDLFAFNHGLYRDVPPFAIGRTAWDNWLIYKARALGARVIDATRTLTLIHQNHDYSHHKEGKEGVWKGAEAQENLRLVGGSRNMFTLLDVNYILTDQGVRRISFSNERFDRELEIQSILRPWLARWIRLLNKLRSMTPSWVKQIIKRKWEKKQSRSSV